MRRSRLLAVLTAILMLGAAPSAQAAYTLAQLQVIETLLLDGNLTALRQFLENNPGILDGDDPLAIELREFLIEQQSALSDFAFGGGGDNDDDDESAQTALFGADPY
ncbi:MAG: hypothetical protein AAFN59_13720 [Pseudomonadota bacterium]